MKRSRKTNRVSWTPGVNLCQVKLFLKEECPSKVGGEHQDNLQAKIAWTLHPSGMCASDESDLPPGFEGSHYMGGYKNNLANLPKIEWKSPRKFAVNFNWHVVAGEESIEVEAQKLREKRVLEAVYPRLTAIPPNPSVSPDVEVERYDDSRIPLVPLTPIEDDEGADVSSGIAVQAKIASNFETPALIMPPGLSNSGTPNMPQFPSSAAEEPVPGVSSDMMAAALAALTTVMKSKEQGSLVDPDLLVKILSDPKMVEKLIQNHGLPSVAADGNVVSGPSFVSEPLPCSKPATISSQMPADRNSNHLLKEFQPPLCMLVSRANIGSNTNTNISMISGHRAANGSSAAYSTLNQVLPALSMMPVQPAIASTTVMQTMEANRVKDANYFKNLIREHGRQKEEANAHNISQTASHLNHIQNSSKTKFRKPCMFYNSSKGCRQGSNCTYLHDNKLLQWQTGRTLESQSAKRMKLSG
ncbi:hypothetical protein V6N13_124806 [Hibiscus sabdariffa]|uniref:C3H1-type domain-containing protein n=1 Tax=Hibiscus sabdariffa TaxID=183260 RepID=A0ABR2U4C1_9ROSI